jgi:hypothetical protein
MTTLRQRFRDDFASSAFCEVAGDPAIVGKWGSIVELEDGTYDCWLHGGRLTEHRISAVARKTPEKWGLTRLDGEAYTQGRGDEFVRFMAPLVGVKRKKRMSDEAKARAAERLRRARENET